MLPRLLDRLGPPTGAVAMHALSALSVGWCGRTQFERDEAKTAKDAGAIEASCWRAVVDRLGGPLMLGELAVVKRISEISAGYRMSGIRCTIGQECGHPGGPYWYLNRIGVVV